MIRRLLLALIGLVAVGVVGFSLFIRFAPLDPSRWHVEIATSDPPAAGTCAANLTLLLNGARSTCLLPATPTEILIKLNTIALATPRTTRLAGTPEAGRVSWVTRSNLIGYPDIITAQVTTTATGTRLDIFSRQVYGSGDWGVNAARLKTWLPRL